MSDSEELKVAVAIHVHNLVLVERWLSVVVLNSLLDVIGHWFVTSPR